MSDNSGIDLNSANGVITVTERLKYPLRIGPLNNIQPWVLEDTPPVLSLGQLVMLHGFGFYWPPFENPYLIAPNGETIADLEVVSFCPILKPSNKGKYNTYHDRYGCPAPPIPPRVPVTPANANLNSASTQSDGNVEVKGVAYPSQPTESKPESNLEIYLRQHAGRRRSQEAALERRIRGVDLPPHMSDELTHFCQDYDTRNRGRGI